MLPSCTKQNTAITLRAMLTLQGKCSSYNRWKSTYQAQEDLGYHFHMILVSCLWSQPQHPVFLIKILNFQEPEFSGSCFKTYVRQLLSRKNYVVGEAKVKSKISSWNCYESIKLNRENVKINQVIRIFICWHDGQLRKNKGCKRGSIWNTYPSSILTVQMIWNQRLAKKRKKTL